MAKAKFYPANRANELFVDQLVLCKCPDWCSTGFQVALWNGKEFYYDDQPNGQFDETVIEFMPLDEDGIPDRI